MGTRDVTTLGKGWPWECTIHTKDMDGTNGHGFGGGWVGKKCIRRYRQCKCLGYCKLAKDWNVHGVFD
jgi:hypothetical protein